MTDLFQDLTHFRAACDPFLGYADLVILSNDYLGVAEAEIKAIRPLATMLGSSL